MKETHREGKIINFLKKKLLRAIEFMCIYIGTYYVYVYIYTHAYTHAYIYYFNY